MNYLSPVDRYGPQSCGWATTEPYLVSFFDETYIGRVVDISDTSAVLYSLGGHYRIQLYLHFPPEPAERLRPYHSKELVWIVYDTIQGFTVRDRCGSVPAYSGEVKRLL